MPLALPTRACHNCRRRRHRCDRSLPGCHKCARSGEECLGYGQLLRWTNSVAIRGKLAGKSNLAAHALESKPPPATAELAGRIPLSHFLVDPLLQDMNAQSRIYINHFNRLLCIDLVSVDSLYSNPFRSMLPLIKEHSYLREIVIATAAIHLTALRRARAGAEGPEVLHALSAKHRAIRLLREALLRLDPFDRPILLSAVVFFINFDLIDSGMGEWKTHMEAAGTLITSIEGAGADFDLSLGPLCDAIVADCLTYHILGSTINPIDSTTASLFAQVNVASILHRTEAISYHCCPPVLLEIVLLTSQLGRDVQSHRGPTARHVERAVLLMDRVVSFDVESWVRSIKNLSPGDDLEARIKIGFAHQAAVRLYILIAVPESSPSCIHGSVEELVGEILHHLSSVPVNHILLKGTVWPTFLAGAQMDDAGMRTWCRQRFRSIWYLNPLMCPWGYIHTAVKILEGIWDAKDRQTPKGTVTNWLQLLRSLPNNCLIV